MVVVVTVPVPVTLALAVRMSKPVRLVGRSSNLGLVFRGRCGHTPGRIDQRIDITNSLPSYTALTPA